MKNYAKLACVVVCLSPLALTSCQAIDGFFGGGSTYHGQDSYRNSNVKASQQQQTASNPSLSSSSSSSSRAVNSTVKKKGASSAAVPVEPPSVHTGAASVPKASSAVDSSNASTNSSAAVPVAPTVGPVSAPNMLAPDANQ